MWSCLHATIPPIIDPYVPSSIYKSLGAVNIGYNKYVRWFTLLGQWCILWCWCGRFVYNYVLVLQGVYRRSDLCLPPSSGKAAIGGRRSASPSGRGLNLGQEAADAGRSPADPSRARQLLWPGRCRGPLLTRRWRTNIDRCEIIYWACHFNITETFRCMNVKYWCWCCLSDSYETFGRTEAAEEWFIEHDTLILPKYI